MERSFTCWNKRAIPSIWTSDLLFLWVGKLNTGHFLNLNSFWLYFYQNKRERKERFTHFKKRAKERFTLVCQKMSNSQEKPKSEFPTLAFSSFSTVLTPAFFYTIVQTVQCTVLCNISTELAKILYVNFCVAISMLFGPSKILFYFLV